MISLTQWFQGYVQVLFSRAAVVTCSPTSTISPMLQLSKSPSLPLPVHPAPSPSSTLPSLCSMSSLSIPPACMLPMSVSTCPSQPASASSLPLSACPSPPPHILLALTRPTLPSHKVRKFQFQPHLHCANFFNRYINILLYWGEECLHLEMHGEVLWGAG